MDLRARILPILYRFFPFDLRGDLQKFAPRSEQVRLSCIINFYGRLDLLSGILHSLAAQDLDRDQFEVILVEDQGGTEEGRRFCESFSDRLPVCYFPLDKNFGRMGYSRNFALSKATGEFVLFLDDDTVLLQTDFLSHLLDVFDRCPEVDAIVPRGRASYALVEGKYDYHEPFFMTSRCMAYRRAVLEDLGGFVAEIIGQEDVEFVVRFFMEGRRSMNGDNLEYFHPPLQAGSLGKPKAVGRSFARLKSRYPLVTYLLLLGNCCRQLPMILFPSRSARMKGRFALGFLLGVGEAVFNISGGGYRD